MPFETPAPGWPGIPARWTSSAKSGVGTALSAQSRVWFTLSHGILNEIYYPRIDQACTRDFGLIVTDGRGFFSEEKRDTQEQHPADRRRRAGLRRDQHLLARAATASRRRCCPILGATSCCSASTFTRSAGRSPTIVSTRFLRRISSIGAPATPPGSTTTRACRCCSRRAPAVPSRSPARPRCSRAPPASSASRTAGRISPRHFELRWRYDRARDGNVALTGEIDLRAVRRQLRPGARLRPQYRGSRASRARQPQ